MSRFLVVMKLPITSCPQLQPSESSEQFPEGMFKLNAKFNADPLLYSLSHFEYDGHTVHMLTQWCLPPPLTSTVKSSLFTHVHSTPLSLAAELHCERFSQAPPRKKCQSASKLGSAVLYWGLHSRVRFSVWSTEWGRGSRPQARNMAGFYAPNSGWLSSWGLGIGLFEPGDNLSLVVLFGLRLPCGYPSWQSLPFWFPGLTSAVFFGLQFGCHFVLP